MRFTAALVAVLAFAVASSAGDYGLLVDDDVKSPCAQAKDHSRNACTSASVLTDLRRHHLEDAPLQVEAVRVGLAHCTVSFRGATGRDAFYRGIAELVAQPTIADEAGLLHAVACVPFAGMRRSLEAELAKNTVSDVGRNRLERAIRLVSKNAS